MMSVEVECPSCDRTSSCGYQCEHCGRDLATEQPTEAVQ